MNNIFFNLISLKNEIFILYYLEISEYKPSCFLLSILTYLTELFGNFIFWKITLMFIYLCVYNLAEKRQLKKSRDQITDENCVFFLSLSQDQNISPISAVICLRNLFSSPQKWQLNLGLHIEPCSKNISQFPLSL